MKAFFKTAKNYLSDSESNIFRNYIDALLGTVVLLLLPLFSLISMFFVLDSAGLVNYAFPISSICIAGAYDTYGRYKPNSPGNLKLGIRLAIDFCVIVLSLVAVALHNMVLIILAPALLIIPGLLILSEVFSRVSVAISISKWYAK